MGARVGAEGRGAALALDAADGRGALGAGGAGAVGADSGAAEAADAVDAAVRAGGGVGALSGGETSAELAGRGDTAGRPPTLPPCGDAPPGIMGRGGNSIGRTPAPCWPVPAAAAGRAAPAAGCSVPVGRGAWAFRPAGVGRGLNVDGGTGGRVDGAGAEIDGGGAAKGGADDGGAVVRPDGDDARPAAGATGADVAPPEVASGALENPGWAPEVVDDVPNAFDGAACIPGATAGAGVRGASSGGLGAALAADSRSVPGGRFAIRPTSGRAPVPAEEAKSSSIEAPSEIVMTPPQTEQRARIAVEGTLLGSTRKTDRHSGQDTFTCPPWHPADSRASFPAGPQA